MSSLQTIERTATIAWSPTPSQSGQPLMATATVAGALDSSFSSTCTLEIFEVPLDRSRLQKPLASVQAPARFHRLGWSSHKEGTLIGGMEDGSVGFWSVNNLLSSTSSGASNGLTLKKEVHNGAVRGLSINPINPFLVSTGSADAEILIWDLKELKSLAPGTSKSTRLGQITDLSFSKHHPFILAAASSNGCTSIWDLRHRREILHLVGKQSVSAIAWNPDETTCIATASDDNSTPVVSLWDLRNANAPDRQLSGGHSKGILSLAWCPQDSDLLLSSGKDNKIVFWNPKTSSQLGGVEPCGNWIYDLAWWPRNPDLFSAASFDGTVSIFSYQSISSGASNPATSHDIFGATATPTSAEISVKQIPKWLKRPISASFGFGGQIFIASGKKVVSISSVADVGLDSAIAENRIGNFCRNRAEKDKSMSYFWKTLAALSSEDYRKELLGIFGISIETISEPESDEGSPENIALPNSPLDASQADANLISAMSSTSLFEYDQSQQQSSQQFEIPTSDLTGSNLRRRSTFSGAPFKLYPPDASNDDKNITKAIIAGHYSEAVDLCIKADRLSDALLVAVCGGPNLIAKTQKAYFQKVKSPYLRIVSGIVKKDLSDVVENADLQDWRDILSLICAKAEDKEISQMCLMLAERLATANDSTELQSSFGAIYCYILGGDAMSSAALILKNAKKSPTEQGLLPNWIESLVDRIRTTHLIASRFSTRSQMTIGDIVEKLPELYRYFLLYSFILEERGNSEGAASILGLIGIHTSGSGPYQTAIQSFGYRLSKRCKNANLQINAPFELVSIVEERREEAVKTPEPTPYFFGAQTQQQAPTQPSYPSYTSYQAQPQQPAAPLYGSTNTQSPMQTPYVPPIAQTQYGYQTSQPVAQPTQPSVYAPTSYSSQYQSPSTQYQPTPQYQATPQYGAAAQYPAPATIAPPSIPKPSIPAPGPVAISPTPVINPTQPMPHPNLASTAPKNAPGVNTSGFNDAPLVQPKIPKQAAPITSPVRPVGPQGVSSPPLPQQPQGQFQPPPQQQYQPPSQQAPSIQQPPPQQPPPQQQQVPERTPAGTVQNLIIDPSKIPANLMPIYQSFSALMGLCTQRAPPTQKRIIDDASKRMQSLVVQLCRQEFSPSVITALLKISQQIQSKDFNGATEGCQQLMSNNFNEVGLWIMAAKRLVDLAKTIA
jgi:protein transport protein SEC31